MYRDKWESLRPNVRKALEILFGFVMAGAAGFFLIFLGDSERAGSAIVSLALVLMLPRIIESLTGCKLPAMRVALLIGLVVVAIITLLLALNITNERL